MATLIRPTPIVFRATSAPRVTLSDRGAEVLIDFYAIRFRRIDNGDLVGGDVFIDVDMAVRVCEEEHVGADLIDQLRALAVELIARALDPDLVKCPGCGTILSIPVAPHRRAVTEVLCGPKHEVRFDDGGAFTST